MCDQYVSEYSNSQSLENYLNIVKFRLTQFYDFRNLFKNQLLKVTFLNRF